MDEFELVRRCQAGDLSACEALFRQHASRVLQTAYLILGDQQMAEDVMQQATQERTRQTAVWRLGALPPDAVASPSDEIERRSLVADAVLLLPAQQRAAVVLFYFHDRRMDTLIKDALEERALRATVPADAWERQEALLLTSGATEGKMARRRWWGRWGMMAEVAAVGVLLVALMAVGISYSPLRPGGGKDGRVRVVDPSVPDELNPRVTPTPHVVVAPNLPVLTPPASSVPQEQIIAAAVKHAAATTRGGQWTLNRIAFVDGRWELEFRGDARDFGLTSGPMTLDPRKGAYSHVDTVDQLTYQIIGATGEIYSIGFTGGPLRTGRSDLEHYRGFVVSGGDHTTLRLVKADGEREGRDLIVLLPGQVLSESGLSLWHLNYGVGRQIDVWGLTSAPGEVLAYRVTMNDRPGEALLAHDVVHGIPIPDGVKNPIYETGTGSTLDSYTVASLKAWYEKQMPKYGWEQAKLAYSPHGDAQVLRFITHGWQYAEVAILPAANGVKFTLTWGMTQLGNQDQAVAAVFSSQKRPAKMWRAVCHMFVLQHVR